MDDDALEPFSHLSIVDSISDDRRLLPDLPLLLLLLLLPRAYPPRSPSPLPPPPPNLPKPPDLSVCLSALNKPNPTRTEGRVMSDLLPPPLPSVYDRLIPTILRSSPLCYRRFRVLACLLVY